LRYFARKGALRCVGRSHQTELLFGENRPNPAGEPPEPTKSSSNRHHRKSSKNPYTAATSGPFGRREPDSSDIGQKITAAELKDEKLVLSFENSKTINVFDDGQSCCESRYMRTDDDVKSLIGHKLVRIEVKDGDNLPDEYGSHEVCFLEVGTDDGFITISNHNESNGYYGGFSMCIHEAS